MKKANRPLAKAATSEEIRNARLRRLRQPLIHDPLLPLERGHLSVHDNLDTWQRSYYYIRGQRYRTLTPAEAWEYIIQRWLPEFAQGDVLKLMPHLVEIERKRPVRRRAKRRRRVAGWKKEFPGLKTSGPVAKAA